MPLAGCAFGLIHLSTASMGDERLGAAPGDDGLVVDALTEPPSNGKPAAKRRAPAKRKGSAAEAASLPEVKVEVKEEAAEAEADAAPPAKRRRAPSKAKLAAEANAAAAAQVWRITSVMSP